ncbi:hypothetical protein MtrunA17_Chr2g0278231 [Medicago truncatula]|uniref:Uncharacterized protein n=1 Tax=Medicago truncatula TaxID=3880 RepID=A0A396J4Z0_MEDTR|nr:hypothetical protein MtrunA17_Chr2g0278231 [Medicago truncatula]
MVKERDRRERVRNKNAEFFICGNHVPNVTIIYGGIIVYATYGALGLRR